ncbi:unnamed protein product [Candidula unifasciata]|uniref:Deltamethrin resistance protein prag01 domain-containing protein n=1 Tax=Candidula unifasciata TaxID=100452 RepID=A0A8S3YZV1_9EUPU|nr:unnamed protein product [Candidula unifasciata]
MLTKVVPVLRATSLMQPISRSGHGVPHHWKSMREICLENKSHMDCLPVPEGCWQEAYNKQNAKRNMTLGASILSFIVTWGAVWKADVIYLNRAPPMYNCKKPKS